MTGRILVTCGHLQRHIAHYQSEIEGLGFSVWVPPLVGQQFQATEMKKMVADCEVVIAGDDPLGAEVLEAGRAGRLRGVVRWGIGTDNVDKLAATKLGLPVYNTPGMFNNEVADLAIAHLLCLVRHVHKMDRDVRAGLWTRYEGTSLNGKILGVVGLGGVGRELLRRARAFGMTVHGSDVVPVPIEALAELGAKQVSFSEVLSQSDVIVLACSLTAENRHMMNAAAFSAMKPGAIVINVARGPIIDETALVLALESGQVSAAGLDVFEEEPLRADSPLRRFDNCLFGTHSGSSTTEAIQRTNRASVDIGLAMLGINPHLLAQCNRVA